VLDNGGGDVVEAFATFGELVDRGIRTHIIKDDDDGGS